MNEIDQRVNTFIPAALTLLEEKTDSVAALAQEKLNAVWDAVFSLPVYRDLKMDEECNYHTFQRLMADEDKWAQVQDQTSEGHAMYQGMMAGLVCFTDNLRRLRKQIAGMTERYLEPLGRRNSDAYADAYSRFYADMICVGARLGEDFNQNFPMQVDFVPMRYPNEENRFFIAEKATLDSLTDFLRTEFYRGLAMGNAPRRSGKGAGVRGAVRAGRADGRGSEAKIGEVVRWQTLSLETQVQTVRRQLRGAICNTSHGVIKKQEIC